MPTRSQHGLRGSSEYLGILQQWSQLSINEILSAYSKRRFERKQSSNVGYTSNDLKDPTAYLNRIHKIPLRSLHKMPNNTALLNNLETLSVQIEDLIWQAPSDNKLGDRLKELAYLSLAKAEIYSHRGSHEKADKSIQNALLACAYLLKLRPDKINDIMESIESNLSSIPGIKLETKIHSEFSAAQTTSLLPHRRYTSQYRYR